MRFDMLLALLLVFAIIGSVIKDHKQPFLERFYSPQAVRVFDTVAAGSGTIGRTVAAVTKKIAVGMLVLFRNLGFQRRGSYA